MTHKTARDRSASACVDSSTSIGSNKAFFFFAVVRSATMQCPINALPTVQQADAVTATVALRQFLLTDE